MTNKKVLITIFLAIILIIMGIFIILQKHQNEEVISEPERAEIPVQEDVKPIEEEPKDVPDMPQRTVKKTISSTAKEQPKPVIDIKISKEADDEAVKSTVEIKDFLKDDGPQGVVVVDKEYKMQSGAKYVFK